MSYTRGVCQLLLTIALFSVSYGSTCSNDDHYLGLSDQEFYKAATGGNKINGCYISINTGNGACDLYTTTPTRGALIPRTTSRYSGWPRTPDGRGTGCVRAPDYPKRVNTCYYRSSAYELSSSFVDTICTTSGLTNAVRQVKDAIRKGQCNECEVDNTPRRCPGDFKYLFMPTDDVYNAATGGKKINGCYISVAAGRGACYLYAITPTISEAKFRGWPRTTGGLGTGCVRAPDLPKHVSTCYYRDARYELSEYEIGLFCSDKGRDNAASQIRHAIYKGQCNQCGVGS